MKDLIRRLHPLERKIIPYLNDGNSIRKVSRDNDLKLVEVTRVAQWLESKKLLKIKSKSFSHVGLEEIGKKYAGEKNGLPERKLLKFLAIRGPVSLKNFIPEKCGLNKEEFNAALGQLKKKVLITLEKGIIDLSSNGQKALNKKFLEEDFLDYLAKYYKDNEEWPNLNELNDKQKLAYNNLRPRQGIIATHHFSEKIIEFELKLEELQNTLKSKKVDIDLIEALTPEMIKSGEWRKKDFRAYDVEINVPQIYGGKRQPYMEFLNKIKAKLVQLGFKEMTGPLIESEFFNFDALFQPQNHPARTWTDTYHLKEPVYGKLPDDLVVNRVKMTHEDGGQTASKGWGYKWSPEVAMQLMPRAQGTALSARTMASKPKIPCRYFAIARCYRPDVLDATHLLEFNQMEGFVADESITFKALLGILKQFAIEVAGAEDVRFFPDYYPFTEPSVQMSAKHPKLGWVELGGAGIFRPEVTNPLGIDVPVMAWGLGIDRLAMFKLGIKDIRYLFSQDLKWLREPRMI